MDLIRSGSSVRIRNVYPRILIRDKEFKYFLTKTLPLVSQKYDLGCKSRIRFFPFLCGSRIQGSKKYKIPDSPLAWKSPMVVWEKNCFYQILVASEICPVFDIGKSSGIGSRSGLPENWLWTLSEKSGKSWVSGAGNHCAVNIFQFSHCNSTWYLSVVVIR